jgi:hypothetical protein
MHNDSMFLWIPIRPGAMSRFRVKIYRLSPVFMCLWYLDLPVLIGYIIYMPCLIRPIDLGYQISHLHTKILYPP